MKSFVAMALVSLALSGCGGGSNSESDDASNTADSSSSQPNGVVAPPDAPQWDQVDWGAFDWE